MHSLVSGKKEHETKLNIKILLKFPEDEVILLKINLIWNLEEEEERIKG